MSTTIKVAIPMAGLGTRMRPHTWSKPKPLIGLAGKTVLDYMLEQFNTLPAIKSAEFVFIVGPNQLEQIQAHMHQNYPRIKVHYFIQSQMRGQSDALYLAREQLCGPVLMCFSDTLIETDLSGLTDERSGGIAWVKRVPDPRRFGVAELDKSGHIKRLIEKPKDLSNNLVLAGLYYFHEGQELMQAIQTQMERKITLNNEYFLVDAINILLERGANFRTREVDIWLDAGKPEALLDTNQYLLEHGRDNSKIASKCRSLFIIPPVYIHTDAKVQNSVIGPHVSIARDCQLDHVIVKNSIIEEGTSVENFILENSLLGRNTQIKGRGESINVGDNSWIGN